MQTDTDSPVVASIAFVFAQQRKLAEGAAQQVDDAQFFHTLAPEANSIAILMKHVGGNLRSRWTDFLTSDGEKPDRNRDGEFVITNDTRSDIMRIWNTGWTQLETTLASLRGDDLGKTVTIRAEAQTVTQALTRSLAHASHHAGQIVLLARALAGDHWQTLSIPRNKSQRVAGNFWV